MVSSEEYNYNNKVIMPSSEPVWYNGIRWWDSTRYQQNIV